MRFYLYIVMSSTCLKICKNFLSGLRTQHCVPQQGILLGTQERSNSLVTNTVKCVIPYGNNEQELVTLLASYMNHRGLSVIGWIFCTDRESSYQRIAQSYFETFTSALVKVIVANCASISIDNVGSPQDSNNPRRMAEEAADLLQHMVGLCVYNGIKHDPNIGDYIFNGFVPFIYPVTVGEVMGKIMSIDQLNHDLACDPLEFSILSEIQSGLAGNEHGKMDLSLIETLAQSSTGVHGKKFRSRRATSASAFSSSTVSSVATSPISAASTGSGASEAHESNSEIVIDDVSSASVVNAPLLGAGEGPMGKTRVTVMNDSDVQVVFGSGSEFVHDTLVNSPLLYSEFDHSHLDSLITTGTNPEILSQYMEALNSKYQLLLNQSNSHQEMLDSYAIQCKELEFLFTLWNNVSRL